MTKVTAKTAQAKQESPSTDKGSVTGRSGQAKSAAKQDDGRTDRNVEIRAALLALRERLCGTVMQLRSESLTRDDEVNPEEDGTDAFERLFSLERASTDHHTIQQIDEALRALEEGVYGKCEMCGCEIEAARLNALPFAKTCVACQSDMERMRGGLHAARRAPR